jgi:hypothetical protein
VYDVFGKALLTVSTIQSRFSISEFSRDAPLGNTRILIRNDSRRDGSPFMNLLQTFPLCDSHGKVRYFIGAQIDVSGLAMGRARIESLKRLQAEAGASDNESVLKSLPKKTEFQELGELFSPRKFASPRSWRQFVPSSR